MNTNTENIFDDFLCRKLNDVLPENGLFTKIFQDFIAERKVKRKRRIFFWFFLLITILSLLLYIFTTFSKDVKLSSIEVIPNNNTSFENNTYITNKVTRGIKNDSSVQVKGPVHHLETANDKSSILETPAVNIDSLSQKNDNGTSDVKANTKSNSSASVSSNNMIVNIQDGPQIKQDSIFKRATKPKQDTFYIVW
ncbi:MAG: hypothetical protein KF741_10685 [Ferruginibacter sp.]|nr:hypothetical protein [Bacteroidota bacterium]MBX2919696.1 hypothetical protein [Ferruginibacter sp.]MCC7379652.1 hypothetical protein [Chitinophagaceae bacterium]